MRAEIKEYQAVEAATMKLVKSVAEDNSAYAKELFTDEAVLFGYLDGKLEHGSIEQIDFTNVLLLLKMDGELKCVARDTCDVRPAF